MQSIKTAFTVPKTIGLLLALVVTIYLWTYDPNVARLLYLWTYDPDVARLRVLFPSAQTEDCSDFGWLKPGILKARASAADPYEDNYLCIKITDQPVDLTKFADIPFVVLDLGNCKVSGLQSLAALHIDSSRSIFFRDCDVRADPAWNSFAVKDPLHATFSVGGP